MCAALRLTLTTRVRRSQHSPPNKLNVRWYFFFQQLVFADDRQLELLGLAK